MIQRLRNLRTLRSLRHRNFRLLLEGALVSSSGDFMQNVAQSWLVWHVSRSPVAIGVIAFFDTLPRLLVGAVGGAIADRFDRRRVLMITQALAMIQAIIYWLLVQFDVIQLWHIAALAFFLGVVNTINQTARQSLVNSLVPRDELLNAIGLQSSVFNFSKILGPSVGGVIIAYIGIAGCFLVNAISFIYLLFNLYQMHLPTWEKRSDEKSMWTDVKEGFSYLSGNRRLLYIVGLSYVVATFVAPYNRFVPIFATNVLHVGASGFGLLMSAPGVGATVAALVLASVNKLRVGVRSICACQLGFALSIGLFAFSHQFLLSFLFLAMVGFCQIAGRALSNTAIQTSTPDNLLGRVLSIFFMDRGLWSLGSMLIGALGAVIGMDWTFALCGAICAITAVAVMSISRKYRAEIARRDTERILKTDLGA
ncbi:MAG TPA: MFS transporter [Candidatus Saccharimonadales bacterium]|nr:MFS transporter [Candidatus Saccharimonadales bacterium]